MIYPAEKEIGYNYYDIRLSGSFGDVPSNTASVPISGSNLTATGNGTIVGGGILKSPNFVLGSSGWQLDSNGNLEANDGNFRGDITGATGTFSGTLTGGSLNIPNTTTASSCHIDSSGNTWWGTNIATGYATALAKILADGSATFKNATIGSWTINTTSIYTGTEDHSGYTANAGDITIYSDGSNASIHAKNFYIDASGIFNCVAGVIDGTSTIAGITGTQIGYVATSTADSVPTGLACSTTTATVASDGSVSSQVVLTWNAISTNTFDHYQVRYKKATATYYTYIPANTNTITIEGLVPNLSYNFGVASINKYGTSSAFSADISQTTATSTTAPGNVASVSASAGIQYSLLTWTHNSDSDLASYNIYRHTSNDSGAASLIGNCRTNYFIDGGRTGGTLLYYWVKAVNTSGLLSAAFSTVTSCTPRDVGNADISSTAAIAASKVLIDGTVYLSNWRHSSDVTKIDGGDIYAASVTTTQLNFTPVQSTDVIAKINASAEGITIEADNLSISASCTFASGYDPTSKTAKVGGTYDSAASGARVRIFPDANTGIQVIDDGAADVFKCLVGGANVGDVTIGNYSGGQGIFYDKSASKLTVKVKDLVLGSYSTTVSAGSSIQTAINTVSAAGGGTVILNAGTHTVNYDITIPSGVYLVGVTRASSIIDFNSNANSILIQGSNTYSTGTVAISNNGTGVVGTGTVWTDAMIGRYIMLDGVWYPITARADNTHITIGLPYGGIALSGASYMIASRTYDVQMKDFTVKNSATSAVKIQYCQNINVRNIEVETSAVGFEIDYLSQSQFVDLNFVANNSNLDAVELHYSVLFSMGFVDALTGNGITLNSVKNSKFDSLFVLNSAADGINITNCNNLSFVGVVAIENAGQGIELVSGNSNLAFTSCGAENNASDGFKFTATSDRCFISTSSIKGNGAYGVNIAASTCDGIVVVGNTFDTNTSGHISDGGTGTVISGNVPDTVNPKAKLSKVFVAGEALTAGNAVYYGYDGNCLNLERTSSQYARITDAAQTGLDLTGDMTIEAWISLESLPGNGEYYEIASKSLDPNDKGWRLNYFNDSGTYKFSFFSSADGGTVSQAVWTKTLSINTWYHVAAVFDAGVNVELFVNASSEGTSATVSASLFANAADFCVGALGNPTNYFDGLITDVRVWSDKRTSTEISTNYQTLLVGNEAGLVGYWKMDNDYLDTTANNNDLTAINGPSFYPSFPFGTTKIYKTSASNASTSDSFIGFAETAADADANVNVILAGILTTSSLTFPHTYYLSDTAGAISTAAGTNTRKVGIAISATELLITNIW